jgi:hypothetical protein
MISFTRILRPASLALVGVIAANSVCYASSNPATPIQPFALHEKLVEQGLGKRVKVTEVDGTVIKGTLVAIDTDSFDVTPKDTTQPTRILNTQVHKFGRDGLPTGAKVGIGIAVGFFGALLLIGLLVRV